MLLEIGLVFSYVYRNQENIQDGIDYILLSTLPMDVYSYVSQYGNKSFPEKEKTKPFDKDYFNIPRQVSTIYQESCISNLITIFEQKNIVICPKIMYYLTREINIELFNIGCFIILPIIFNCLTFIQKKSWI